MKHDLAVTYIKRLSHLLEGFPWVPISNLARRQAVFVALFIFHMLLRFKTRMTGIEKWSQI